MQLNSEYIISILIMGLATVAFFLLKYFHTQAMNKLDQLIKEFTKMSTRLEVHNEKLEAGAREFIKIEEHQKLQDIKIQEVKEEVLLIKAGMINYEQVPRTQAAHRP